MTEVSLVGCKTYTRAGKQYDAGTVYNVDRDTAEILLAKENAYGIKYFQEEGVKEAQSPSSQRKKVSAPVKKATPTSIKVSVPSETEETVSL